MEEDSILEWIEYHLSIGIEHFYIYGNDDDYSILLNVLLPYIKPNHKLVTFIHCEQKGAQAFMYYDFLKYHAYKSRWICLLDQDEYIRLAKNQSVSNLTNEFKNDFDSIELNWLFYGNSGYKYRPKGSVLKNYLHRSSVIDVHTKHLTKSRLFYETQLNKTFWHSLPMSLSHKITNITPNLKSFENYLNDSDENRLLHLDLVKKASEYAINKACIAHYAYKSEDDFLRRVQRSTEGQFGGQAKYIELVNDESARNHFLKPFNSTYDDFLKSYWTDYLETFYKYEPKIQS